MHRRDIILNTTAEELRRVLRRAGLSEAGSEEAGRALRSPGFCVRPGVGSYVEVGWLPPRTGTSARIQRRQDVMLTALGSLLRLEGYAFAWSTDRYERDCLNVTHGPEHLEEACSLALSQHGLTPLRTINA